MAGGGLSNDQWPKLHPIPTGKTIGKAKNKGHIKSNIFNLIFMVPCTAIWQNEREDKRCSTCISPPVKYYTIASMRVDSFKAALCTHTLHSLGESRALRRRKEGFGKRARAIDPTSRRREDDVGAIDPTCRRREDDAVVV